jgi:hypothetical protein
MQYSFIERVARTLCRLLSRQKKITIRPLWFDSARLGSSRRSFLEGVMVGEPFMLPLSFYHWWLMLKFVVAILLIYMIPRKDIYAYDISYINILDM